LKKRVYKFLCSKYGISALKDKRLKISEIKNLNDPFDIAAIDTTNPQFARALSMSIDQYKGMFGLLCFSRNWDNLLLWSHYSASHKGICLGFDISEGGPEPNYDMDVLYQPNLLPYRRPEDVNFDLVNRLLRTKHESWSYEQEVRMFVGLDEPPDAKDLHWFEFGPHLVLKEVIIGAKCDSTVSKEVEQAVEPYGDAVKCWWADMRTDAFLLVKQTRPPH
jgi:hypothetical protein